MKYTIKEFSEHLGITTDTLRLYEKQGIVKPIKDAKNNYRYFDDLDARNLLACRWYRSLDIPLKEAAKLTMNADEVEIYRALIDKKNEIDLEIERLMALSKIINDTCELMSVPINDRGYEVKTIPAMVRFVQTNRNTLISDIKVYRQEAQIWMDALPSVIYTFKGDFTADGTVVDYTWGMAMSKDAFDKRLMAHTQSLEYVPEMLCLTTVVTSPYEEFMPNNAFDAILNKAIEMGYDHQGFILGRLIVSACFEKARRSHIELMLPIKKNSPSIDSELG